MDTKGFVTQQFVSLQRDIESRRTHLFWIVVVGLLVFPFLGCAVVSASSRAWITLPLVALVLIMLFLSQESQLMRAERYIRDFLEKNLDFAPCWETWLESRPELRLMDCYFSASFVLVFFVYYFLCIALALYRLWIAAVEDPSGTYWWDFVGAAGVYTVTTLWALAALVHHWRSSAKTG